MITEAIYSRQDSGWQNAYHDSTAEELDEWAAILREGTALPYHIVSLRIYPRPNLKT